MGQRSQIYIRYKTEDGYKLIANYYGWNYSERMISRASSLIDYIKRNLNYGASWVLNNWAKLRHYADVNFDMQDVVMSQDIFKEYVEEFDNEPLNDFIFKYQDNNDGKLFIDILEDKIKYCFTDYDLNLLNASDYIYWNTKAENWLSRTDGKTINTCVKNIKSIDKNAELMTQEELNEFIDADYKNMLSGFKPLF